MPRPRLPHLQKETTRHGRIVWYFRRGKEKRIRLDAAFGSAEFLEAYKAAEAGNQLPKKPRRIEKRVSSKQSASVVYFALAGDLVKIGVTTNPTDRLAALSTTSAVDLSLIKTIPGDVRLERELHQRFSDLRVRGEWFRYTEQLADFIAKAPDPAEAIIL